MIAMANDTIKLLGEGRGDSNMGFCKGLVLNCLGKAVCIDTVKAFRNIKRL